MTRHVNTFSGDLAGYGYGPEFNWFTTDAAPAPTSAPAPAPAPAPGPASTPNPGPVMGMGAGLPASPTNNSGFTGNVGSNPNPAGVMADPASRADTSGMNFGMGTQPGVDYSGSLDPSSGSTWGSTGGKILGGVTGSMLGAVGGPLGSILGGQAGKYLGGKLGGLADTPGSYGNSALGQGLGVQGTTPTAMGKGYFGLGTPRDLFGNNQAPVTGDTPMGGAIGGDGGGSVSGGSSGFGGAGSDSLTGPGGMGGNFGTDRGVGAMGQTGGGYSGMQGSYGGTDPTGGGGLGSPSSTSSLSSMGGEDTGGFGGGMGAFGGGDTGGGGSGSRVICTELFRQGLIPRDVWVSDLCFTRRFISETTVRGYQWWGVPAVKLMRRSPRFSRFMLVALARPRAEELAYRMGHRDRPNWHGRLVRLVMEPLCWLIGSVVEQVDYDTQLYASPSGAAHAVRSAPDASAGRTAARWPSWCRFSVREPGARPPEGSLAAGHPDPRSGSPGQPAGRGHPAQGVP